MLTCPLQVQHQTWEDEEPAAAQPAPEPVPEKENAWGDQSEAIPAAHHEPEPELPTILVVVDG